MVSPCYTKHDTTFRPQLKPEGGKVTPMLAPWDPNGVIVIIALAEVAKAYAPSVNHLIDALTDRLLPARDRCSHELPPPPPPPPA